MFNTSTKIALALLIVLVAPAPSFARAAGQEEGINLPVSGSPRGHFAMPSESRRHIEVTKTGEATNRLLQFTGLKFNLMAATGGKPTCSPQHPTLSRIVEFHHVQDLDKNHFRPPFRPGGSIRFICKDGR
jgi:hypothetical protein